MSVAAGGATLASIAGQDVAGSLQSDYFFTPDVSDSFGPLGHILNSSASPLGTRSSTLQAHPDDAPFGALVVLDVVGVLLFSRQDDARCYVLRVCDTFTCRVCVFNN